MIGRVHKERQSGSVLITVLLIVAVLSVLAVAVIDDIRFGMRRAANVETRAQAHFYALGAETFAKQLITTAMKRTPNRTLRAEWMAEPAVFTLDDGIIEAHITDGSNCFNINSLVEGEGGRDRERHEQHALHYGYLLNALDFSDSDAESLVNAAVDWIDSDSVPNTRGGEDYYYAGLVPPYRAANTLVAEVPGLRAIRGYGPDVMAQLRGFVCAHPTTSFSRVNVNTLTQEDAPLLVMVLGPEKLTIDEARSLIAARPADGYRDIDLFWAEDILAGKVPNEETRALVSLKTDYYDLKVQVSHLQAYVEQTSLLEVRAAGDIDVVSRRYGAAE